MNEILQKRIEEAAYQYIQSDAVAPENMQLAFGDFINGAKWGLQNQWISVEEALPEEGEEVFVTGGHHRTLTATYYKATGFIGIGMILSSTHWMPIPPTEGGEK